MAQTASEQGARATSVPTTAQPSEDARWSMHGVMFPVSSVTARPSACEDGPRSLTSKVLYANLHRKTGRDLQARVQLFFLYRSGDRGRRRDLLQAQVLYHLGVRARADAASDGARGRARVGHRHAFGRDVGEEPRSGPFVHRRDEPDEGQSCAPARSFRASWGVRTGGAPRAPPPPSRTNWTRLVPPPVLTGHVPRAPAPPLRVLSRLAPRPRGRARRGP